MISILIPVYNTDVRRLVSELSLQIQKFNYPFEIVVADDGSDEETRKSNTGTTTFPFVKYHAIGSNTGRVPVRKTLAALAIHDWVLFLDDDSGIDDAHFLEKYFNSMGDHKVVIAGGRHYARPGPSLCELMLHWKYGSIRESKWTSRETNSKGFQTNNFLIHKTIFNAIVFPDGILDYGHEDTWMGMQLENMHCTVKHIKNPVTHLGLQSCEQFLLKSEQALQNLHFLGKICPAGQLSAHVKIYRRYAQLKKLHLLAIINIFYSVFQKYIYINLRSCNPDLYLFDLYRLHYFIKISR